MNPIQEQIAERLAALPNELSPIVAAAKRRLGRCCAIHPNDDVFIAHQPWKGFLSYQIVLFAPAQQSWFSKYSQLHGVAIPPLVQELLIHANGYRLLGLDLYGMTPSMLQDPPLLSRSAISCLDIGTAEKIWKYEYNRRKLGFHFGSRDYSDSEVIGYFLTGDQTIQAVLREKGKLVGEWPNITKFLADELAAAEKLAAADAAEEWRE